DYGLTGLRVRIEGAVRSNDHSGRVRIGREGGPRHVQQRVAVEIPAFINIEGPPGTGIDERAETNAPLRQHGTADDHTVPRIDGGAPILVRDIVLIRREAPCAVRVAAREIQEI